MERGESMLRTVPSSGNQEINLYLRTYYSLLRSSRAVQIQTLSEAHKRMHSALHVNANEPDPDFAAFIYSILRLPACLDEIDLVILDHTYGPEESGGDHLSAHEVIEHLSRMREEGLMSEHARAFATHIAHEGNPPHPQLAAFAAEHGYEIGYDGLTV